MSRLIVAAFAIVLLSGCPCPPLPELLPSDDETLIGEWIGEAQSVTGEHAPVSFTFTADDYRMDTTIDGEDLYLTGNWTAFRWYNTPDFGTLRLGVGCNNLPAYQRVDVSWRLDAEYQMDGDVLTIQNPASSGVEGTIFVVQRVK